MNGATLNLLQEAASAGDAAFLDFMRAIAMNVLNGLGMKAEILAVKISRESLADKGFHWLAMMISRPSERDTRS